MTAPRGTRKPQLELCVETLASALSASLGGADRLELCTDLSVGGVTPSLGVLEEVLAHVTVPVHILIRPRAGDFLYSAGELRAMERDIRSAREAGAAGVVIGVLTEKRTIDIGATRRLADVARPMRVTFHRAFDITRDLGEALDGVIAAGADMLLTSGGRPRVTDALPTVAGLVARAAGHIEIIAGSGVRLDNARRVLEVTGADALHTSLRRVAPAAQDNGLPGTEPVATVSADEVRLLAGLLRGPAASAEHADGGTPARSGGV